MAYAQIKHNSEPDYRAAGKKTNYFWAPYAGITKGNPVTKWKYNGDLGHLTEVADVELSAINEEEILEIGNNPVLVNEGYEIPEFTVTFHGASVPTIAAFVGQDLTTLQAIEIGQIFTEVGCLVKTVHNEDGVPMSSHLFTDLSVKIINVPGMTADGITTATVTLFSKTGQVFVAGKNRVWNIEAWYDNGGSIVNANAPDGVTDQFILGEGNNVSGVTAPVTTALVVSNSLTTYKKYLPVLKVTTSGVTEDVTTNNATFTVGTGVIDFATGAEPADGSILYTAYLVQKFYSNSYTNSSKTEQWDQWQEFDYLS